eukprot:9495264-Pyramimonas_sp.AAC.1
MPHDNVFSRPHSRPSSPTARSDADVVPRRTTNGVTSRIGLRSEQSEIGEEREEHPQPGSYARVVDWCSLEAEVCGT